MNTDILIVNLTSVHQCIIDDIGEVHDEFLMINARTKLPNSRQSLKTVKFAEVAKIREFCDSRVAREN